MKALELDQQRISGLLDQLGARLNGEWLLVGGALVSIWVEPRRVTQDIDLIGLTGSPNERLDLMDAVFALGLPIEAVNSAADFFVHRIPGWRDEIEVLRRYSRCVVLSSDTDTICTAQDGTTFGTGSCAIVRPSSPRRVQSNCGLTRRGSWTPFRRFLILKIRTWRGVAMNCEESSRINGVTGTGVDWVRDGALTINR